ncbi:aspartate 1-decarboxylase [Paenibacillus sp. LMG 31461]|uniref:Aspartate 1-decarboxylase n=1 Tax=Paenibacillus plantarum TaxID=2654975 RepID=A0ABX1X7L8_9BACL|nr:aspartate 1-decarboxylase [Paenibacillus plantarum]NOU64361.1 aspartate 1-decarboxylase [Paenibacillus plantarum]
MFRIMHKSKIHGATVTEANLNYTGSITIDKKLMAAANIRNNEKVLVVNKNTGGRLETYAIHGEYDSGMICLNGAAARMVQPGDKVIVISFGIYTDFELGEDFTPIVIFPDDHNRI